MHDSFRQLLVVERAGSAAGSYCGKLFADYGAEVVLLGDRRSAFHDVSKRAIAPSRQPSEDTVALLERADIVIVSTETEPLGTEAAVAHSDQIVVRVAPFGTPGPYANWRSTDLVDAAISGHLRLSGDPEREPLQGVPDLVHHAAGAMAFISAMAALIARQRGAGGQQVDVSHHETLVALHQFTLLRYTHNGAVLNRMGNRYAGPGAPIGGYECADGFIGLVLPQEDQMERMLEVTGLVSMLELDGVDEVMDLMTNPALLDSELVPYLKAQRRDDIVELFQALRLPCAPVSTLAELRTDAHLRTRQFWTQVGEHELPGPPFTLSRHAWALGPKTRPEPARARRPEASTDRVDLGDGPLTGIRVLDMTRVWAGPLATRILADLGAEVLMTEVPWTRTGRVVPHSYVEATHFFPDDIGGDRPWNRSGFHNKYAINKYSTVIELDKPEGRELFAALVPTADVLVENYSPRVMPAFGFDEDTLRRLNPDLVYVTMPGYGRTGPHADWVAYGPTLDGHVGHTWLTGYRGESPWKCGIAWPDPIGGMHGAAAALVGLFDRLSSSSPGGQTAEVAQFDAAVNMIGQHLDGDGERWGNRRPGRAPQGVYPCRGDDRWIAVSVVDDRSWRGLCRVLGLDGWTELSFEDRWARHDELDRAIGRATSRRNDHRLMHELQEAGVPAGAVLDAADVVHDPQLAAAGFFHDLAHPDAGTHRWPGFPGRLSRTPATMRRSAPLMGEHNEYATRTIAGYSDRQYQSLLNRGILRTEPPG